MRKTIQTALQCATALCALTVAVPQPAWAADADTAAPVADEEISEGTITVTARKRDESIVDVPLAISVVTSDKIEKLGITSTTELANFVPGLQFSDYTPGYARNDRGGTRPLIFRGLNVGTGGSVSAGGGMFLDGAAVVGNEIPASMDIGAVEVLRGPQSVYFGRSTMTGAVSYRTKAIPDNWGGEILATLAERHRDDIEASIAGPVIPGLFKVRLTGLYEKSDGYMTNTYDGSTLGDRSRKSVSLGTEITPTEKLRFKTYINYFRDEDGPSATAYIPASVASNCNPALAAGYPAETARPTICGKIPGRANSVNYMQTNIPTAVSDYIFASPLIKSSGFKDQIGLQREVMNSHIVGSWDINDYVSLESITAYHTNTTLQAADGKSAPATPADNNQLYFYSITNKQRDFSQELRLTSDSKRAFSWTFGGNFIDAYDKTQALNYFVSRTGSITRSPQPIGKQTSKTFGLFGGAYLKVLDNRLTFSAEGRYQWDERGLTNTSTFSAQPNSVALAVPEVTASFEKTFKSFNPRIAVDYDIGGGRKIYASYATGTRPGGFNGSLQAAITRVGLPAIQAAFGLTSAAFDEEKLKIGELGIKGSFMGGKGYFDINTYYGKLSGQQIGYSQILPGDLFSTTATANVGEAEIYGVEWQGSYTFMRGLSLSTTFAWNHSERTKFDAFSTLLQYGTRTLDGVKFANTPEISGSAVLSYEVPVSDEWNFFYNGSLIYRGKQYMDTGNLAYIDGRWQADIRFGLDNKTYTLEAFVTNVFNDRSYTAGSVAPNYDTLTYHAFYGAWAPPRTFGGRLRVKF